MRRLAVLLFLFLLFFAVPQTYAACYSRAEAEAEQGLRLHSELMVIGLNCQHLFPANGRDLYAQYRDFTHRNKDLFAEYELILMRYFEKSGVSDPARALHTLRTEMANNVSENAALMRPDLFCAKNAPRIAESAAMQKIDIRRWAGQEGIVGSTSCRPASKS